MWNKGKLITPFLMLFAGALASVILYIRQVDLYTMLWVLLAVLVIFYVIGDIARYIYDSVRPRVIPEINLEDYLNAEIGSVVDRTQDTDFEQEEADPAEEAAAQDTQAQDPEEYADEEYDSDSLEEDEEQETSHEDDEMNM